MVFRIIIELMNLTIAEALQQGIAAHKEGKLEEADRFYTAILKKHPMHADANHNMGILAVGVGKVEQSLSFFRAAVDTNPNIEQFWLSYVDALLKIDRIDDAKKLLEKASASGISGNGLANMKGKISVQFFNIKCYENAANYARAVILLQPTISDAYNIYGTSKLLQKNYEDAIKQLYKHKLLAPILPTLALSKALAATHRFKEAVDVLIVDIKK